MRAIGALFALSFLVACADRGAPVPYPEPNVEVLVLDGEIDETKAYVARVTYYTNDDSAECMHRNWFEGVTTRRKVDFNYEPDISGNAHSITLPLRELDPTTQCEWRPGLVWFCIGSREEGASRMCYGALSIEQGSTEYEDIRFECMRDGVLCLSQRREGARKNRASHQRVDILVSDELTLEPN